MTEGIGQAHHRMWAARRQREKIEKRAGRAQHHYDQVNGELTEAIDVFASGNWGDLDLREIAQAGGKIDRLARMLIAANRIEAASDLEAKCAREYRELQEAEMMP